MVQRVFLGWDQPFVRLAAHWLLDRKDDLPGLLVVVPTTQAGRRLRLAMAEVAGSLLPPQITTPGGMMQTDDASVADRWVERLAWQETLENLPDPSWLEAIIPASEGTARDKEWAGGLAKEMVQLRHALQENGLTLNDAARRLSSSVEADRWQALARLEDAMERQLGTWKFQSRSRLLATGIQLPQEATHLVLCGITELPPVVERAILTSDLPQSALISAPECEADSFSECGLPDASWADRLIPWPAAERGAVHVTSDPQHQARTALQVTADAASEVGELALGTADSEAGDAIESAFTQAGWTAFHPASRTPLADLRRWFQCWSAWLADPKLATLIDLLALPETGALIDSDRATVAGNLSSLRDQWMSMRPDDLRHRIQQDRFRDERQKNTAIAVLLTTETLEQWRAMCLRTEFIQPLHRLLDALATHNPASSAECSEIRGWIDRAAPLIRRLDRSARFWIELMLSELPAPAPSPPDNRMIDVQGWLELLFEPGSHLVLCGLNEGKVPAKPASDPWLGESAKEFLGLPSTTSRASRDAFLLRAMIQARHTDGRCDLLFAKTQSNSEPMLPSRLLLAAPAEELPQRVTHLFQELEPPDARLRWHADWKWRPEPGKRPNRINATSLRDYLACPFRFYIKHALHLRETEPDRIEWNARDFGNVAHDLLEDWGRDPEARNLAQAPAIHRWLAEKLDAAVDQWFGPRIPVAVRIQAASLRQRLHWFSEIQAQNRADGWEVVEVEEKREIDFGNAKVITRIDRIDRHADTGELRVIDYKTGGDKGVDKAHRSELRSNTRLPEHIAEDGPAIYEKSAGKGTKRYRWTNLQLPLYALAIRQRDSVTPIPCYFKLGDSRSNVQLDPWHHFDETDLESAEECTRWIIDQITRGVFGPPAEKVTYDDIEVLTSGHPVGDTFLVPNH